MNVDEVFDVTDEGIVLRVHAQPGAGRSAVVGRYGDALKVKVAAPPVEGRANEALVDLLVRTFGVPRDQVTLVSGASGRTKRFRLDGVEPDAARTILEPLLTASGGRRDTGHR
jgi:uncharacterized protein (TIGR00251 family)